MDDAYTLEEIDDLLRQQVEEDYKGYTKIEIPDEYLEGKSTSKELDPKDGALGSKGNLTVESVRRRIRENDRIVISSGDGGLATGVYLCDIYEHRAEVDLPPNTFALADEPDPVGYSSLSPQVRGIVQSIRSNPSGNRLVVFTYTIVARFDLSGRLINRTIPTTLPAGFDYTYTLFQ